MVEYIRRHAKLVAVGASCAGLAAGAGTIASATAATGHQASHTHKAPMRRPGPGPLAGLDLHAVHGQVVVPTKTGFATVTFDRGEVKSVSGQQLQIAEGTPKSTYQTVTLTIPAGATVRIDGQKSTLDKVTSGEHVTVVQGPNKTCVLAGSGPRSGPNGQGGPRGQRGPGGQGGPRGQRGGPNGQGGKGGPNGRGGQGGPQG